MPRPASKQQADSSLARKSPARKSRPTAFSRDNISSSSESGDDSELEVVSVVSVSNSPSLAPNSPDAGPTAKRARTARPSKLDLSAPHEGSARAGASSSDNDD